MSLLHKGLIDKIKQGDIRAYEKVFRELYAPLCGYANKIIQDHDKSEETVQEVFYNIWRKRETLKISVSLKSYLYKSVQNNCLQLIQHQLVKDKYNHYIKSQDGEESQSPEAELEAKEIKMVINKSIDSLPVRCKEIFLLNRYEGLKYREIAEKLSISQKTVEANISKALQHLRKNLKQYVDVI